MEARPGSLLARALNQDARRYFLAPPRLPRFPEGSSPPGISQGRAGRQDEGTAIRFELEIDGGFVKSARFSAYGCPHTLAVTAWLCEVMRAPGSMPECLGTPADWAGSSTSRPRNSAGC